MAAGMMAWPLAGAHPQRRYKIVWASSVTGRSPSLLGLPYFVLLLVNHESGKQRARAAAAVAVPARFLSWETARYAKKFLCGAAHISIFIGPAFLRHQYM